MTNLFAGIDKFNLELAPKKAANPYSVKRSATAKGQKACHKRQDLLLGGVTSELILRHPRQLPVGVPAGGGGHGGGSIGASLWW